MFGDSDILSFARISQLNWIGHINRMDSKREVSQVFNNPQVKATKRMTKKNSCGIVYRQTLINAKLQTGKRGQKTELTGRSLLRRQMSAVHCNATEEEEEKEEKEEEE